MPWYSKEPKFLSQVLAFRLGNLFYNLYLKNGLASKKLSDQKHFWLKQTKVFKEERHMSVTDGILNPRFKTIHCKMAQEKWFLESQQNLVLGQKSPYAYNKFSPTTNCKDKKKTPARQHPFLSICPSSYQKLLSRYFSFESLSIFANTYFFNPRVWRPILDWSESSPRKDEEVFGWERAKEIGRT